MAAPVLTNVSVRKAVNGFVVSSYNEKTGRENTHIAKDKQELAAVLTKVGL